MATSAAARSATPPPTSASAIICARASASMRCAGGSRTGGADGAANLGIRPTFDPPKELLEPYFFDFSGDLYGQTIEVELVSFLRPEEKFDGLDALKAQMAPTAPRRGGGWHEGLEDPPASASPGSPSPCR
jgi:hypothetical protein